MKATLSTILVLAVGLTAVAARAETLAVKAGRLIDPKSRSVVPNAVIQVENGKVKAIGPSIAIPAGSRAIDLSGYTVGAAELIGRDDIGALEPGKWADLIAVKSDPLADVAVLEKVSFVMREGKVYKDARERQ
jgi:imidazolonepropionase-like amidohydrolase